MPSSKRLLLLPTARWITGIAQLSRKLVRHRTLHTIGIIVGIVAHVVLSQELIFYFCSWLVINIYIDT
jgi:hypothetical protein